VHDLGVLGARRVIEDDHRAILFVLVEHQESADK
jgi:hypothetical protein